MTKMIGLPKQATRLLAASPCPAYRLPNDTMTAIAASRAREAARVDRLVLGKPRPVPVINTTGLGKQERKAARAAALRIHQAAVEADREWTGREATPETLRAVATRREGSLARLYRSGDITADQLAAAEMIAAAHRIVVGDVAVAIASIEARVDRSPRGSGCFYEALGAVRVEVAYTRWRAALPAAAVVLDMVVGGIGFTVAARRHKMADRRAKRLLVEALDLWPHFHADARRDVDPATLAAAHAGIL